MSGKPLAVAIVGAGGLAAALARALGRSGGARVKVASRRPASAAAVARGARGVSSTRRIEDAIAGAAIVVLAVPDRAVAQLARSLVPMRASWRGVVVLHAAGAYGPELLAPLGRSSASTGVLHPLAVLGAGGGAALSGHFARIEGQAAARAAARRLCALAGLVPLRGPGLQSPKGRSSYHAAASLVSRARREASSRPLSLVQQNFQIDAGVNVSPADSSVMRNTASPTARVRSAFFR